MNRLCLVCRLASVSLTILFIIESMGNESQRSTKMKSDVSIAWARFEEEFDWRIMGPGRRRIVTADGVVWKQVIFPEPPQGGIFAVRELESWKSLINVIRSNGEDSIHYFRSYENEVPASMRRFMFEMDYIWFAVTMALDSKLYEETLKRNSSAAAAIFRKKWLSE